MEALVGEISIPQLNQEISIPQLNQEISIPELDQKIGIPQLNQDILDHHLFIYLSNDDLRKAAQVCSLWHSTAYSPTPWIGRTVQLHADQEFKEDMLISLAERQVRHLIIKNCNTRPKREEWDDDYDSNDIEDRRSQSQIVNDNRIRLQSLLQHLSPILYKLDFRGVKVTNNDVQKAFNNKMDCLTQLHLSESVFCSTETAVAISRHCPKLEEFHAYVDEIRADAIPTLGANMPNLRKISFGDTTSFKDITLEHIKTHMPNLESLTLNSTHITTAGIAHIAKMPYLQQLTLSSNCTNIRIDFIDQLAWAKSPIRQLSVLASFTDGNKLLRKIGSYPNKLQIDMLEIGFDHSIKVTDKGLEELKENKSFPFRKLTLRQQDITVHGLAELRKNCPNIELELSCGKMVDFDASLQCNDIVFKQRG